ncbi:hypothetical protein M2132_001564 [Dysgonomonas sp. PH5-45]|nr:hypothetical protein [Dysgonomonas sp. PH5-45]MDH6388151.1 hypothetical protein [Dysgonomonas sp. PH5-37]
MSIILYFCEDIKMIYDEKSIISLFGFAVPAGFL